MQADFIERLITIAARSRLAELEYSEGNARVRIVMTPAGPAAMSAVAPVEKQNAPVGAGLKPTAHVASEHVVAAAMAGTFFRRVSPEKAPLVSVGEKVEEGQALGLLEAMKMLNPIEADRPGRIVAILEEDSTMVETGTPLFVLDISA